MTVLEGIQKSAEFLAGKGVESPRLNAELLLAHILRLPRMKLYLNFERPLTPAEVDQLRAAVRRRGQREPLQHITGTTFFCGLEMETNRNALVPRPETELLAEAAWSFLATLNTSPSAALDFGTGSGCIAIALAHKTPGVRVVALDISKDALELAAHNAARHQVADRMEFICGAGLAALPSQRRFNLIVSNPPYIPSGEIPSLEPEVRDYDPRLALDGGGDGLDFYRDLAARGQDFLEPNGKIMLEFGDGQAEALRGIFESQNWVVEAIQADYSQRLRILVARR